MKVKDIMTEEVETCGPEMTIEEVSSIMSDQDADSIRVVEKGGRHDH